MLADTSVASTTNTTTLAFFDCLQRFDDRELLDGFGHLAALCVRQRYRSTIYIQVKADHEWCRVRYNDPLFAEKSVYQCSCQRSGDPMSPLIYAGGGSREHSGSSPPEPVPAFAGRCRRVVAVAVLRRHIVHGNRAFSSSAISISALTRSPCAAEIANSWPIPNS